MELNRFKVHLWNSPWAWRSVCWLRLCFRNFGFNSEIWDASILYWVGAAVNSPGKQFTRYQKSHFQSHIIIGIDISNFGKHSSYFSMSKNRQWIMNIYAGAGLKSIDVRINENLNKKNIKKFWEGAMFICSSFIRRMHFIWQRKRWNISRERSPHYIASSPRASLIPTPPDLILISFCSSIHQTNII